VESGKLGSMLDETFAGNWQKRFGFQAEFDFPELARFLGHRSIRHYSDKPVSEDMAKALVGCAQSAATSSNLQLYSIVSAQDPVSRDRLATLCANDQHVRDCAWYFCFLADHYRIRRAAEQVGEDASNLDYAEFYTLATVDAAIAAERMVCAAEALGLGICYIGGLRNHPTEVAELLDLPEGTFGLFGMCIGWPAEPVTAEVKPRLRQEQVWFREKYDRGVSTEEYDARMRPFYEEQKMKGDVTWSMRSGRRLSLPAMKGREVLLELLREKGFLRR
jgi:nitroreductase